MSLKNRETVKDSPSSVFEGRVNRYVKTSAASLVGGLAAAHTADAVSSTILYTDLTPDEVVNSTLGSSNFDWQFLDLNGDGFDDISFEISSNFPGSGNYIQVGVRGLSNTFSYTDIAVDSSFGEFPLRLAQNDLIDNSLYFNGSPASFYGSRFPLVRGYFDGSNVFSSGFGPFYGGDASGAQVGYIGFRLTEDYYYTYYSYFGWIRVEVSDETGANPFSLTITDFAIGLYPGASILAGQTSAIPEPSPIALLAGGAAFLAVWRKRKRDLVARHAAEQND